MQRTFTRWDKATPAERFWSKVEFTETCWRWQGAINKGGYGSFGIRRGLGPMRTVLAHRWAYEFCVGAIPEGLTLDHLCRVRNCVNPDHLEPVSLRANTLRGISPHAQNARKTHCPQGHPYDEGNTYVRPYGGRDCRVCRAKAMRNYSERQRAHRQ